MTRLTLATIVRDEESFLPGCLDSVKDVVDHMVVVDTGSTDRTVELARGAGATVVPHRWTDDFAAARNAALAEIPDGFVLVLDADERLAPAGRSRLRAEVERDEIDCGVLPLYNAQRLDDSVQDVLDGARISPPALLGRLLRLTPDLAWEGVVHEHLTRWALAHPRRKQLDAPIVHYGEVASVREARQKSARNLRLLQERVRLEPDNPHTLSYLAQELLRAGEKDQALELAERAWSILSSSSARPDAGGILPATLLGQVCIERREFQRASAVLTRAAELCNDHPNLRFLLGCACEQSWIAGGGRGTELLRRAEEHFRAAIAFGNRAFAALPLAGVTTWSAWTRLGTVLLLQGRSEEAVQVFDLAVAASPAPMEAQLGRIEAHLAAKRWVETEAELADALEADLADASVLAAMIAREAGDRDEVAALTRRAVSQARAGGVLAPHRLLTLRAMALEAANGPQPR